MAGQCRAKVNGSYVHVETFCGILPNNDICIVGDRPDLRHIVRMRNLRVYPADVVCVGKIRKNPNKLVFTSSVPTDTPVRWEATDWLDDKGQSEFSHVMILSVPGCVGDENVSVEVTLSWPTPGQQEQQSLVIIITAR